MKIGGTWSCCSAIVCPDLPSRRGSDNAAITAAAAAAPVHDPFEPYLTIQQIGIAGSGNSDADLSGILAP